MRKIALFTLLTLTITSTQPVFAWSAYETDLQNLGFSPETIRVSNLQKSRMEDMAPIPPERNRVEQIIWNFVHNEPLSPSYPFGHFTLRY